MDQTEENFSPVCAFSTVRFFLVSAMMLGWITHSADFSSAFTQAELEEPLFVSTPRGFKNKCGTNGCLRLLKNLCGSRLAPRNWCRCLRAALVNELGFTESTIDPCLLCKKDMTLLLHVDDMAAASPTKAKIDELLSDLRKLDFELELEDDFAAHPGIGMETLPNGSKHMVQKGLIKKLLQTADMLDCKCNW